MERPKPKKSAKPIFEELRSLLEQLDGPPEKRRKGPGRPTKNRADTTPVIVHLYKSQVHWLDEYAEMIHSLRPDNARLSRAEVVRGLLLGLGRHAIERKLPFPADIPIRSERDLQHAIARTLGTPD